MLFLHDMGYDFFNIPRLTMAESNLLVKMWNEREKEESGSRGLDAPKKHR